MLYAPAALLSAACTTAASAGNDLETINRIRNEGLYHSQVMATLQHLTDHIGPRLTGSPEMQKASAWTVEQLKAWGLSNVHLEGFEFGRGSPSGFRFWRLELTFGMVPQVRRAPGNYAARGGMNDPLQSIAGMRSWNHILGGRPG